MWFVTLPTRDGLFIHLLLLDAFNLNAFNNEILFIRTLKAKPFPVPTHSPSEGSSAWLVSVEPSIEGLTTDHTEHRNIRPCQVLYGF
jgi:hypothetical protein